MDREDYLSYISGQTAEFELNVTFGEGILACGTSNESFVKSLFGDLVSNLSIVSVPGPTGLMYTYIVGNFSGISGSLGEFLVKDGKYVDHPLFFIYLPYMSRAWGRRGLYLAGYSFFIGSERASAAGLRFAVPVVINSSWPADWLGNIYVKGLGSLGLGRLIAGRSTIMGEYHLITARPDLVDMVYKQLYERGDDFVRKEVLANGTVRMVYDPLSLFINKTGIDSPDLGKMCHGGESGGVIWLDCRATLRMMGEDYATNTLPFPLMVSAAYDAVTHALVWLGPWDAVYGVSDKFASNIPKIDHTVYLSLIEGSLMPVNLSVALEEVLSSKINASVDVRDASLYYYYPGSGEYVTVPIIVLSEVKGLGSVELSGSFSGGMLYSPPLTVVVFIALSVLSLMVAVFRLPRSVVFVIIILLMVSVLAGIESVAPAGGSVSNARIILTRSQSLDTFTGCGSIYLGGYGNITLIISNPPSQPYNLTVSVRRHDGVRKDFSTVSFQSAIISINASPGMYSVCVTARPVGHEGVSPPAVLMSAESRVSDSWRAWRWWGVGVFASAALALTLFWFVRRWLK